MRMPLLTPLPPGSFVNGHGTCIAKLFVNIQMVITTMNRCAGMSYAFPHNGVDVPGNQKDYSSMNWQTSTGHYSQFGEMAFCMVYL
jgi:hypothetical protein